MKSLLLFAVLSLALTGCTHVVTGQNRAAVDSTLTLEDVVRHPEIVAGKSLLTGGLIVAHLADGNGSALELIPWDLDCFGEPVAYAVEHSHLVAITEECLDPERFEAGRLITVAATVTGRHHTGNDGLSQLPEVKIVEIYLWDSPLRYGLHPSVDPYQPSYAPPWFERDNPYDPAGLPTPLTPPDFQRR